MSQHQTTNFEELVEYLPVAIALLNIDDRVVYMNSVAKSILGANAINRTWEVIVKNVFIASTSVEGAVPMQELCTYDGEYFQATINLIVEGEVQQRVLSFVNVSAVKHLEKQVAMVKRVDAQVEFAASLAHQIRTPLTTALLYTSQLSAVDNEVKIKGEKITKSLQHLARLVDNMLDYTRGKATSLQPEFLDNIVADLLRTMASRLLESGVTVQVVVQQKNIKILVDRDSIITALQNLVNNAIDVTVNGKIEVHVKLAGVNQADIIVKDFGTGISEDRLDKVFQPFYTSKAKGTGLGLALVKNIAEANNGTVWVNSVKNLGSEFGLRLLLSA